MNPRPIPDDSDEVDDRYADERINQQSRPWVGYAAVAVSGAYVVLGVVLFLVPPGKLALPRALQLAFAGLLVVYGLWRLRRSFKRYFR